MPRPDPTTSERANADVMAYDRAIYWRGLFLNRYSAVEYSIANLVSRASLHPTYAPLGEPKYGPSNKRKRLRKLIEMEGPIAKYRSELQPSLAVFEDYEEQYRRFMAHALMTPKDGGFLFRMYDHKDGEYSVGELFFSLHHLETLAKEIAPLSTNFTSLIDRVCKEIPLPPD